MKSYKQIVITKPFKMWIVSLMFLLNIFKETVFLNTYSYYVGNLAEFLV